MCDVATAHQRYGLTKCSGVRLAELQQKGRMAESEVATSMLLMALLALMAIGAGLVYVVVTLTRDQRRAEQEAAAGSSAADGAAGGVARGGMARMRAGAARCVRSGCAMHPAHRLWRKISVLCGPGWVAVCGWMVQPR